MDALALRERVEELEETVRQLTEPEPDEAEAIRALGLNKQQARALTKIVRANGRIVSKDAIMAAIYFDRLDDWPHVKNVDVLVCLIRKKLGSRAKHLQTTYGVGYRWEGPKPW